jgi:hypothetical protein
MDEAYGALQRPGERDRFLETAPCGATAIDGNQDALVHRLFRWQTGHAQYVATRTACNYVLVRSVGGMPRMIMGAAPCQSLPAEWAEEAS